MIQNLNQVTFQGFGTVLPERAQPKQAAPKNAVRMKLTQMEASLYRASADTLLTCTGVRPLRQQGRAGVPALLPGQDRVDQQRHFLLPQRLQGRGHGDPFGGDPAGAARQLRQPEHPH